MTKVPAGDFVIKYAAGERWCDDGSFFGRGTIFAETERSFAFSVDRTWTVTLIARRDGNLRTKSLSREAF